MQLLNFGLLVLLKTNKQNKKSQEKKPQQNTKMKKDMHSKQDKVPGKYSYCIQLLQLENYFQS